MHVFGHSILFLALWGANLAVAGFAVWKGDTAVRWAAVMQVAASAVSLLKFGSADLTETFELGTGLLTAGVYLLLAVRFANLWIGAAMLLQAAEFSLDAFYLVTDRPLDHLHAWVNNTCEWGVVLCILLGAVLAILRRMALAREAAELAARRQQRTSPAV